VREHISNEETQVFQSFARAQNTREGKAYEARQAGFFHDFKSAMENCSEHYPNTMATLTTAADFFGITKLENLDPTVAKDKSKGQLTVEGVVGAIGMSSAIAPGVTKSLAEGLAHKLTTEVGEKAAQEGLKTVGDIVNVLVKERGAPEAVEKQLHSLLEKAGSNEAVRTAIVGTVKGLIEKSVPEESAKKAMEKMLDNVSEHLEQERGRAGDTETLDHKVHGYTGRTESGKIVGVYPSGKDPRWVVMHTTDDRYYKISAQQWGVDENGQMTGVPTPGSLVTVENGRAKDLVNRVEGEIQKMNAGHGTTLSKVRDAEMFEVNHPPKTTKAMSVVVAGDAVFMDKGGGNYLYAEKNDLKTLGIPDVKSGDSIKFENGRPSVTPAEQLQQVSPAARAPLAR